MITHIVSDWLFSPCCVEHQDEFIFERVAVAYSRDYNEVGRAQIKLPSESLTWSLTQAKLYNHKDGQRLEISDLGSRWHVLCSKNKDTDQLLGHCTSDLHLCFLHIQKTGLLMTRLIHVVKSIY